MLTLNSYLLHRIIDSIPRIVIMIIILLLVENLHTIRYMIFQFGSEPVLIISPADTNRF